MFMNGLGVIGEEVGCFFGDPGESANERHPARPQIHYEAAKPAKTQKGGSGGPIPTAEAPILIREWLLRQIRTCNALVRDPTRHVMRHGSSLVRVRSSQLPAWCARRQKHPHDLMWNGGAGGIRTPPSQPFEEGAFFAIQASDFEGFFRRL